MDISFFVVLSGTITCFCVLIYLKVIVPEAHEFIHVRHSGTNQSVVHSTHTDVTQKGNVLFWLVKNLLG